VFIIVLVMGVAVVAIVLFALKKRGSVQQPVPQRSFSGPPPRIVEDGFWFDTSGYSPGDVVTYTYTGRNGRVTEQFMVDPGAREQFVYTGLRPGDVLLGAMIANQMQQQPPPPPPYRSRDDDRPRRHPPAY
jgi:hypothetical protein